MNKEDLQSLLYAIMCIVGIAVAYVSFWVLVGLFVCYVLYNVIKAFKEEETTKSPPTGKF